MAKGANPPGEICLLIAEGLVELHKEQHRATENACDTCLLRSIRRDLLSLCLTSKDIRPWAEEILYRDVRVNEHNCAHKGICRRYAWASPSGRLPPNDGYKTTQNLLVLIDTLTKRPKLRKLVRTANINWSNIYDILEYRGLELIEKVEALLPSTSRFQGLSVAQRKTVEALGDHWTQSDYLEAYFTGLLPFIFPNFRVWEFSGPSLRRMNMEEPPFPIANHVPRGHVHVQTFSPVPPWRQHQTPATSHSSDFFSRSLDTEHQPRELLPGERLSRWYCSVFGDVPPAGVESPGNERLKSIEIIGNSFNTTIKTLMRVTLPYITTLTLTRPAIFININVATTPNTLKHRLPNLIDLRLHAPKSQLFGRTPLQHILGPQGCTNLTSFTIVCPKIHDSWAPSGDFLDRQSPNQILSLLARNSPSLKRLILDMRPWEYKSVPDMNSITNMLPELEVLVIDRSGWSLGESPAFPPSLRVLHLIGARGLPGVNDPVSLDLKLQIWGTTASGLLGSLYTSVKNGTNQKLREVHVEIDPDFMEPSELRVESWERLLKGEVDLEWHMLRKEYRKKVEGLREKMEELRKEFAEMGVTLVVRSACTDSDLAAFRRRWLREEMEDS